jgi:hypothetical protein
LKTEGRGSDSGKHKPKPAAPKANNNAQSEYRRRK